MGTGENMLYDYVKRQPDSSREMRVITSKPLDYSQIMASCIWFTPATQPTLRTTFVGASLRDFLVPGTMFQDGVNIKLILDALLSGDCVRPPISLFESQVLPPLLELGLFGSNQSGIAIWTLHDV